MSSLRKIYFSEYNSWRGMKQRVKNKNLKNYGGRGLDMDPRWENFETFLSDLGVKPSDYHTLERIENDKGYWPNNCKWATYFEQQRNRRYSPNTGQRKDSIWRT